MAQKSLTAAVKTATAIAASIFASAAGAEDYRWQVSGGYGETELAEFADVERATLDATYYIEPVDDARGPYALAPFLNRSSRVTAAATSDKTTIVTPIGAIGPLPPGTPTTATVTEETTGYAIGGRYVWPSSGWYIGASYRDADMDQPSSPSFRQGTTIDGYQVFGGRYFGASTSLDLAAGAMQQTTELTVTCFTSLCLSGTTETAIDTDDWSIGTMHVRSGTRLTYAITGRVTSTDVTPSSDDLVLTLPSGALPPAPAPGTIVSGYSAIAPVNLIAAPFTGPLPLEGERELYSVGAEIFPTERLGFRVGLARSDGDYSEEESYDLAATWFFKRAAAVELVVGRTDYAIGSLRRETDSAEVRLFGRL